MQLSCRVEESAVWLQARFLHPIFKSASAVVEAKVDIGASTSVVPVTLVEAFVRQGDPLVRHSALQRVRLGDDRDLMAWQYLIDVQISDGLGGKWRVAAAAPRNEFSGCLALPKRHALIGMDILSSCESLIYYGRRKEAFLTIDSA